MYAPEPVTTYRDRAYIKGMKWLLRIGTPIYTVSCIFASPYLPPLENLCNLVITVCMLFLWFDLDAALPIKRRLIDPYDFTFRISRKVQKRYVESYSCSSARNQHYRRILSHYREAHYVYVLKDASASGYYKIGRTNNPARRIGRFDVVLPVDIHIMFIIPCENEIALESSLHHRFYKQRIQGEWFKLTGDDLEWFMVTYGLQYQ